MGLLIKISFTKNHTTSLFQTAMDSPFYRECKHFLTLHSLRVLHHLTAPHGSRLVMEDLNWYNIYKDYLRGNRKIEVKS